MNKIKTIIFDFDGVIAESVNVKTEAFAEMYRQYGEEIEQKVIEHHESNGGISRFEKFKIYHEEFLKVKIDEEKVNQLAKQFSHLVLQKVMDAPYIIGAYEFLSSNYQKYDFYISTGTPTEEINLILEGRRLSGFFKEVFGSPEKKHIHVQKILQAYSYKKDEVVFVGDALTDRDAARINGIKFVGRHTTTEEIKKEKYLFDNFYEFVNILNLIEESFSHT